MRKNAPRKWLHLLLDLLPVLIIPIFALYSMNPNSTYAQTIDVEENEVVDFNQLLSINSYSTNTYSVSVDNYYVDISTLSGGNIYSVLSNVNWVYGDKYVLKIEDVNTNLIGTGSYFTGSGLGVLSIDSSSIFTGGNATGTNFGFVFGTNTSTNDYWRGYINIINLTKMFGSGNEPTLQQFNTWYPNDYYEYTLSRKELLKDVSTITYDNTDVGSQLLYSIYKPVHDYMNFNNVFNFGAIYDWLQLNIFGGTAPISVFIVWNIFLYEFIMDLIFLLYALFMFFIDFCTNMIDRFHCTCSGR